jgi:hypothetical protein
MKTKHHYQDQQMLNLSDIHVHFFDVAHRQNKHTHLRDEE